MFWNNLVNLCNQNQTTPTALVNTLNIATGSVTKWKNGTLPRAVTLQKIADYFNVSVDYLLGKSEEKEPPVYADGELEENIIVFHRDGKTKKKKVTKEQMAMFMAMMDAIPDTPSDDI